MSGAGNRHGKGPAEEPEEDKFPEGLRVLAVDDDPICLRVLEVLLRKCKFIPTVVTDAKTALEMLRVEGEEQLDLVITDLHMPDMDGFKLLELIGLEMDLPVIMLSVNGEMETIYKGVVHGACDYLVKPVKIKELRNIWQHVVRKNHLIANHNSSDSDDAHRGMVQPVTAEHGQGGAKNKKFSKKKKNGGHDSDENKRSTRVQTTRNKQRVSWNTDLHNRFLEAVNRLGIDNAVPKSILRIMDVKNLSRDNVASHLQKYRLFLKRVADEPKKYNPVVDSSDKMDMNHPGQPLSAVSCCVSNNACSAPSILGPHGLSVQPRNWSMGNGGSMPRNAAPWQPDTSTVPSSHLDNYSFGELPNGGLLEHANQFPVQPPNLVGSSSDPWQNVAPSSFSPGPMDGAPLVPPQANMLEMNPQPSFATSPGQMAMFQNEQQNQMAGTFSNNTSVAGFSEQMMPLFNIPSNTAPVEMTQNNFPPMTQMMVDGGGGISSALPGLQDNYVAPAKVPNDNQMALSLWNMAQLNGKLLMIGQPTAVTLSWSRSLPAWLIRVPVQMMLSLVKKISPLACSLRPARDVFLRALWLLHTVPVESCELPNCSRLVRSKVWPSTLHQL